MSKTEAFWKALWWAGTTVLAGVGAGWVLFTVLTKAPWLFIPGIFVGLFAAAYQYNLKRPADDK